LKRAENDSTNDTQGSAPRDRYTSETVEACESALRTLLADIGPWGNKLILVGGLTPVYLVPELPADDVEPHVGTTDLDVVIGVAITDDSDEAYRTLQKNLRESGFNPSRDPDSGRERSYAWQRPVNGITVVIEFFCPVAPDSQAGNLRRNPSSGVGSQISAIQLRAAELTGEDCIQVRLSGSTLDEGGSREVVLLVANVLPFLVLKAFALTERVKEKDAYDIVWTLSAWAGGPEGAARAARTSPISDHAETLAGIETLREAFREIDSAGPSLYARFFVGGGGSPDERDRLRRFARGTISRFLGALDSRA
jgi:hypothetical protein